MGGDFGEGGEEADDDGDVFGFTGLLPSVLGFVEVAMEALGGDVLGEADLGGLTGFVGCGQVFFEPDGDAVEELADAGLGYFQFFGGLTGARAVDDDAFVGEEVAGRRWEG